MENFLRGSSRVFSYFKNTSKIYILQRIKRFIAKNEPLYIKENIFVAVSSHFYICDVIV